MAANYKAVWADTVGHVGHTHLDCPECGMELCDTGHDEICGCRGTDTHDEHEVFYCDDCHACWPRSA